MSKINSVFIPELNSFEEVRQTLASQFNLIQQQNAGATPPVDYSGSRISNVGSPQQFGDVVTLGHLNNRLQGLQVQIDQIPPQKKFQPYIITTQGGLAGLQASFGLGQAEQLVWVSDYNHMLRWTGVVWARGPGDTEHSDTFHMFGGAPVDVGWHTCDGSTVPFLGYNGTLTNRVLPNFTGANAFPVLGTNYSQTFGTLSSGTTAANNTLSVICWYRR